ncbi:MAG: hypothetical protein DRH12_03700 [Deltaproteobacteria bacterium]|nr:MAG: hypothetical protein DRH12_03700 [Deltaproteobacteria bacterium]
MTKVLNISDRLKKKQENERGQLYRERMRSVHRALQCAFCNLKCSMCGRYLSKEEVSQSVFSSKDGFNLCESCGSEFEDFIKVSTCHSPSELFWQKDAWRRLWSSWINYQEALKAFKDSPEFRQLTKELEDNHRG